MKKFLQIWTIALSITAISFNANSQGSKAKPAAPKPTEPVVVNVAIINGGLPDSKILQKGFEPNMRVFVAGEEEMMEDVFRRVAGKCRRSNELIATVSIFSHGKKGEFEMGMDKVSPRNLKFIGDDFSLLLEAMTADPQLLIYSCESGEGKNGEKLMQGLLEVFPGKIYMSSNLTGKGGDWNLEVSNTDTPAPVVLNVEHMEKFYKHSIGRK